MAYDPYSSASQILNLKGEWDAADEEERKKIQKRAREHYNDLINNGYSDIANQLENSNFQQAQGVVSDFKGQGMSGRVPGRKYMADQLTGLYGYTPKQANDAIIWKPESGDVFLGGFNVGKGDALIDGTNYYSDTSRLDNAVSEYAAHNGLIKNPTLMYNQGIQNAYDKQDQLWGLRKDDLAAQYADKQKIDALYDRYDDTAFRSPTDTKYWNDIVDSFLQLGKQAGYDQIAAGAGSNGGNVDSYSQANADRQLAAFRAQGVQAAQNGYSDWLGGMLAGIEARGNRNDAETANRLNALNAMQNDLGGSLYDLNQQVRDNYQGDLDNQMNRWQQESEITDLVPTALAYRQNPYLDVDEYGNVSLKAQYAGDDTDFQQMINTARANGASQKDIDDLLVARGVKINSDRAKYGQFDNGDWKAPSQQQTGGRQRYDADLANERYAVDSAERVSMAEDATNRETIAANERQAQAALAADERNNQRENELKRYQTDQEYNLGMAGLNAQNNGTMTNEEYNTYYNNAASIANNGGDPTGYVQGLNISQADKDRLLSSFDPEYAIGLELRQLREKGASDDALLAYLESQVNNGRIDAERSAVLYNQYRSDSF